MDTSATLRPTDTVVHVYNNAGTYLPSLTFLDGQGCEFTVLADQEIEIFNIDLDFFYCGYCILRTPRPGAITFTNLSGSPFPLDFEWVFEQGTPSNTTDVETNR